jgi:hypothetical protein
LLFTYGAENYLLLQKKYYIYIIMEVTQYPYSLKFSVATLGLMLILILLLLSNVLAAHSLVSWIVFGVFMGFSTFMLIVLISSRLIPALKGEIALSLDEEGISDYIRNVSINWGDINEISLVRGRSSAMVRIGLKFESDYGDVLTITLRWVSGNDDDIYDAIAAYYECYPEVIGEE